MSSNIKVGFLAVMEFVLATLCRNLSTSTPWLCVFKCSLIKLNCAKNVLDLVFWLLCDCWTFFRFKIWF